MASCEPVEIMEHGIVEAGGVLSESIANPNHGYGFARFGDDVLVRYDWETTDLAWRETFTGRWSVVEMRDQPTPATVEGWRALVARFRAAHPRSP